jgi:hypothetical protein
MPPAAGEALPLRDLTTGGIIPPDPWNILIEVCGSYGARRIYATPFGMGPGRG